MKNAFAASGSSPTRSESRLQPPPDISVENHGSIFLASTRNEAAQAAQRAVIRDRRRLRLVVRRGRCADACALFPFTPAGTLPSTTRT
jgi:hypothetical protein